MPKPADIVVEHYDELSLVRPFTGPGCEWLNTNLMRAPDPLLFRGALVIVPREIRAIIGGMREAGLTVQEESQA